MADYDDDKEGYVQRPAPSNDIDIQYMTLEPHVSSQYMSPDFRSKFVVDGVDYWQVMSMITQDLRLANLSAEESYYVRYCLDWAADVLIAMPKGFETSALIAIQRATTVLETSQSKGGFLRRLFNTIFQHKSSVDKSEPQKRSFFGLGKKQQGGGQQ